ncbi:anthrone oxygenase family protein [Streptomonospora sp. PA3]|uniref:anthrone oxygenase family protein n=1 Tax=Streptomonospora sp. PA3 TaxID=2607326 RepID=UPI0031BAAC23
MAEAVTVAAVVATGLFAGLFCAFSFAVMPGLARSADRTFVEAMQRINTAILNPVFAAVFAGAPVLLLAALALHLPAGRPAPPAWLAAALLSAVAAIAVTLGLNVPLNNALGAAGRPADDAAAQAARARFETAWVRWNTVRSLLSVLALVCAAAALAA